MVVGLRRRYIRMPKPFLHLAKVGAVVQCIGAGGVAHRVWTDAIPQLLGVFLNDISPDGVWMDGPAWVVGDFVFSRSPFYFVPDE